VTDSLGKLFSFSFDTNEQVFAPRITHIIMEDGTNSVYVLTMGKRKMFSSKAETPETPQIDDMNFYCTENAE
jgi:hypothetical protein